MAGGLRRTDTDPGWINRKFRDLERRLTEQQAAKRLPGTEVEPGDNFLVRGILSVIGMLDLTGTVSMKSADGVEQVRMGDMPFGDRGLAFTREDNTPAFELKKPNDPADTQAWRWYDKDGVLIVGELQFLGGLNRPYLEHPFQPVAPTSGTTLTCGPYGWERTTNSATFETLFAYDGKRQNGFVDLKVAAVCSDGSTAGEVQVVDLATGTPLPGFAVSPWLGIIPAGTTTITLIDPTPAQAGLYGFAVAAQIRLGIQVRRTAGAGSITLSVAQAIGG